MVVVSDWFQGVDEQLANALAASSVETLDCNASDVEDWIKRGLMRRIIESPRLKRVVCRGRMYETSTKELLQRHGVLATDIQKLTFVHHAHDAWL